MPVFERAARSTQSCTELNALFRREVRAFGFTAYAVGYIAQADSTDPQREQEPFLLIDWPRAWLELYARQGFAKDDAVVAAARHTSSPFTWKELQIQQPGASARIFAAAREFGWNDGLLVPVSDGSGKGRVGVASLAAPDLEHLSAERRERVAACARFAFRRAEELSVRQPRRSALTPRERDVLVLVAKGYDDAAIGTALHLTKSTAHSYVERAKNRLGAASRAQAVAIALGQGLLDLEFD